jgi:dTDP-4-amino-4,6-dideoxygalactose transaminase
MSDKARIPFVDLVAPHRELQSELMTVFRVALETAGFVGGPEVEEFEREFAAYCDTKYCVGVGSGTDALRLALIAAGVGRGDSVITVPLTFIATTEAVTQAGAQPEFVDIDGQTYTMSPQKLCDFLENKCEVDQATGQPRSRRTRRLIKAVIPVHLYGQTADMDPILVLAQRYNLIVIEDACQAHGAEYFSRRQSKWRKAGSMGHAAAFSFYPGKNLGACGEAGAVTTGVDTIAQTVRMLRDHGQSRKYFHDIEGYNGRLDAIQASILRVKLRSLARRNKQRQDRARDYAKLFAQADKTLILPHKPSWSRPIYHLYVVRVPDRGQLQKDLDTAGIGSGIHYPVPLHLAKAYDALGFRPGEFPVSEQVASQVLSLPMFPELSIHQQRLVANCALRSIKAMRAYVSTTGMKLSIRQGLSNTGLRMPAATGVTVRSH